MPNVMYRDYHSRIEEYCDKFNTSYKGYKISLTPELLSYNGVKLSLMFMSDNPKYKDIISYCFMPFEEIVNTSNNFDFIDQSYKCKKLKIMEFIDNIIE